MASCDFEPVIFTSDKIPFFFWTDLLLQFQLSQKKYLDELISKVFWPKQNPTYYSHVSSNEDIDTSAGVDIIGITLCSFQISWDGLNYN